jgi:hypothetical protein
MGVDRGAMVIALVGAGCYAPAEDASCAVACDYAGNRACPAALTCEPDNLCHAGSASCKPSYAMTVMADQPFAYWRLDDPPGSAIAHDVMGHADGMFRGNCELGQNGALSTDSAVRFDGTTCFIDIPPVAQLSFAGTASFTIEAWVLPDPVGARFMHVFTRETRTTAPTDGYALLLRDSGTARTERAVNGVNAFVDAPVVAGDFRYLAVTYDGAMITLHVDVTETFTAATTAMLNPVSIDELIGAATPTMSLFSGTLDEIAIYDHSLAPSQLAAHFAARE